MSTGAVSKMSKTEVESTVAIKQKNGRFRGFLQRLFPRFTNTGLVFGALFFLASLTPSMAPRATAIQAVLSGLCLAAGYGLGVLLHWLWKYMELPVLRNTGHGRVRQAVLAFFAIVFAIALWRGQYWENIVRELMHMQPVGASRVLGVALGTLLVAGLVIVVGRLAKMMVGAFTRFITRHVPRRIANVIGVVGGTLLLIGLVNGVIISSVLSVLDASYQRADSVIPPDQKPPTEWDSPGSAQSLVAWDQLGRMGRRYISARPSAETLAAFAGPTAIAPLRVYAGLPTADTPEARAKLALAELKRVGGFSRKALVVITPTGTGWVDPAGIDGLEFLYRGDVASVAVQYSYLSSPLTLLVDPESGRDTARALFREVYAHWRTLPAGQRPKLYLHGLSLGALNSERSFEMFELLEQPLDGALWSGPPFGAQHWRSATMARNPGSPVWLPEFRDGSFVRFMNQHGSPVPDGTPWGPMRIVYLQYGSDAVTFFDRHAAFREPEWMKFPRAPDVSPVMSWYPVVTMLQTSMDITLSMAAPMGFGHVYAPSHYVAGWLQVTGIDDWTPEEITRLGRHLDEVRLADRAPPVDG